MYYTLLWQIINWTVLKFIHMDVTKYNMIMDEGKRQEAHLMVVVTECVSA